MSLNEFYILIKYLFKINNLLSKRTKARTPFLYFVLVLFFSITIGILLFLGLFSYFNISNSHDQHIFIASALFFIIILDIMLSMIRFQNTAIIEPLHIIVYPISNLKIYLANLLILLTDYKCLIYLIFFTIIFFYLFIHSNYIAILLLIPLFLLLILSINLYFFIIYTLSYKLLNKIRNSAIIIPIILIAINNMLIAVEGMEATRFIPIVNFSSRGLLFLINKEYLNAIINTGYLSIIVISGMVLFTILSKYDFSKYIRY
jgi:hypothetical protein